MRTSLYFFSGRKLQAPESDRVTDLMKVSSVPTSLQCKSRRGESNSYALMARRSESRVSTSSTTS